MPELGQIFRNVFGSKNERMVKAVLPIVEQINALEAKTESWSDADLRETTSRLRARLAKGETLDDVLPEAFAACREASKRTIGLRHFDVQLLGGVVLHRGMIAEMVTGEGKTLVATLAVYLNALAGNVHVVTVNDYLARRDAEWMRPVYEALGMTVGRDPGAHDVARPHPDLPRRRHLRHELRVRLRLPARPHEGRAPRTSASASCATPSSTRSTRS